MKAQTIAIFAGLFGALPPVQAGGFDYDVKIFACDTRNCEVVETRLPGGTGKARYQQNGIGIEIEALNASPDRIDARVLLRVPNGERTAGNDSAGEYGSSELIRFSSLNQNFYTQIANHAFGENSYLLWGRLNKAKHP
ncbi:MAG: hypothetical protein D3M94_18645 [Rhodocyclales bacterium GT-UBC]|nr:MAG: hypothetical protein D3M94_18645 [Rhodocyclales bacterium GT-UBC]